MLTMTNRVTRLKDYQVFVFGSNSTGFHGAGSAGLACRGDSRNTWRNDKWFLKAKESPTGSVARIGKWAIYGVARGFQQGSEGMSYAIQTIEYPGKKKSTSRREIYYQLIELSNFAKKHLDYEFLCCITGGGYNGWSIEEMKVVYAYWISNDKPSENILILQEMHP